MKLGPNLIWIVMGGDGVLGDGFEELGRILSDGVDGAGSWVNGRFDA